MDDAVVVFLILAVTVALFISDRIRLDLVALMAAAALVLTGILTPAQALAGFGDPLVIMIAALFVVSAGMFQTGVAQRLGLWLGRVAGEGEARLILLIMLITAALSAVMSSTGTVAVMLPIVVSLAWRARISPSKLLIPLAFASLLGGMLTLIGTPPNVVVSEFLATQGFTPFGFFAFTPTALVILGVGVLFMVLVGRHWLPATAPSGPGEREEGVSLQELADRYGLPARLFRLRVGEGHALAGTTLRELGWSDRHQVQVLALEHAGGRAPLSARIGGRRPNAVAAQAESQIAGGDTLLVQGDADHVRELAREHGLQLEVVDRIDEQLLPRGLGVVEILPTPRSRWLDHTLAELHFRERFSLQVVAVQRGGATITDGLHRLRLRLGDTLLVQGPRAAVAAIAREHHDAVVLDAPSEVQAGGNTRKAPIAIAIMLAMLVVMTTGWMAPVVAAGLAAIAMLLTGCLSMEQAYRTMSWESVVLIAAILPMATALQVTGAMQQVVDVLVRYLAPHGPLALLVGVFVLTSLASQVISNTATAVLVAPIAFQAAISMGVSPYPLLMTVALAASTAFSTPVASPVNTLVLGVGQYRFGDFARVGVVMQLLVLLLVVWVVPWLFPW